MDQYLDPCTYGHMYGQSCGTFVLMNLYYRTYGTCMLTHVLYVGLILSCRTYMVMPLMSNLPSVICIHELMSNLYSGQFSLNHRDNAAQVETMLCSCLNDRRAMAGGAMAWTRHGWGHGGSRYRLQQCSHVSSSTSISKSFFCLPRGKLVYFLGAMHIGVFSCCRLEFQIIDKIINCKY